MSNDLYESSPHTLGSLAQGPACCQHPTPHIRVRDLKIAYGDRVVLSDVSLDIYRGCVTALIGPSGCGKTSFLSCLNRMTDMLANVSVEGQIELDGQSIFSPDTPVMALRRRVGMIFQKPNPFPLSIYRNLDLPLRENGVRSRSEIDSRIEKALQDVGLWNEVNTRLQSPALSLSGGQQQRLCIARALVLQPEVLLMDEPCSALDPISSGVVEELITRLQGRYTIVIVTHNLAQARRIANFAAFFWMARSVGQLVEFGRCQKLFDQPGHELTAAYINGVRG